MNEFLGKIKLIEKSNLSLENTTLEDFYLFFNKSLIANKSDFIGQIDLNKFEIKRAVKFNANSDSLSKANGNFYEQNGHLKIDTEIIGSIHFLTFIYVSIAAYLIVNGGDIFAQFQNDGFVANIFLTIVFLGIFILPYLSVKWSIRRFKHDLEKELKKISPL